MRLEIPEAPPVVFGSFLGFVGLVLDLTFLVGIGLVGFPYRFMMTDGVGSFGGGIGTGVGGEVAAAAAIGAGAGGDDVGGGGKFMVG